MKAFHLIIEERHFATRFNDIFHNTIMQSYKLSHINIHIIQFIISVQKMRLFTHNLLKCPDKDCKTEGFPLIIEVQKAIYKETRYNREKIVKVAKKLHWHGLKKTIEELGQSNFPQSLYDIIDNDDYLKKLHRFIYDTHIVQGTLTCPNCAKEYQIKEGFPNMGTIKVKKEEKKEKGNSSEDSDDYEYVVEDSD